MKFVIRAAALGAFALSLVRCNQISTPIIAAETGI
jgi:hypothetical protein